MNRDAKSLLQLMRKWPSMYIGRHSITRLSLFIHGYSFALQDTGISKEFYQDFVLFTEWLASRYKVEEPLGWDTILLQAAGDEEKAFALFWKKWDEFLTCQNEMP